MRFSLNTEKSPFCTVGPFSFTFGQEEHEIDVDQMPDEYKKQLLYNVNRGVLLTEDRQGLAALAGAMQPVTPVPQEQVPIQYQKVAQVVSTPVKDPIKEDLKPLRTLLRQTVTTVKKEATTLSPGRLRKLLELEEDSKNRKSVVSFLKERLKQHEKAVAARVGAPDEKDEYKLLGALAKDPLRSTQVSDIVESEEVQVTFGEDDLQDAGEGGLLLDQDVLYQIEDKE